MKRNFTIMFLLYSVFLAMESPLAADYSNTLGMKFNNIPAGDFYMGSCKQGTDCPSGAGVDPNANIDETPQHQVRITKSFQMGVHEVTLGQFKMFIAEAKRDDLLKDNFIQYNIHGDDAAVTIVTWYTTQDFIRWLNEKEGQCLYRLPTEAEWEYAARAGTTTIYSWGDNDKKAGLYAWYEKNAWDSDVGDEHTHAVGLKRPNAWGLHDMHGNVWEWVQDFYAGDYYQKSPRNDPTGPRAEEVLEEVPSLRVVRSSSWGDYEPNMRVADRQLFPPSDTGSYLGFRLLRQCVSQ